MSAWVTKLKKEASLLLTSFDVGTEWPACDECRSTFEEDCLNEFCANDFDCLDSGINAIDTPSKQACNAV